MKKKLVCYLFLFFTIIFIISFYNVNKTSPQEELSNKLLRFHVIANSNSNNDQYIKMKVKEAVVTAMEPRMKHCTSKEEAIMIAQSNLSYMTQIATETLNNHHVNQSVSINIETSYFPTKTYGEFTFPPGYYDSVRIILGNGKGENWWCVLYPPLCFVDISYGVVPDSSKETLANTLSTNTYNSLTEEKPKLGFRFFTFLNRFLE